MSRTVIVHRFGRDSSLTLHQVMNYMEEYRSDHPNRDVFFDGDKYAICYVKK